MGTCIALCAALNEITFMHFYQSTPHELFFSFHRKSQYSVTLPAWLTKCGPVLLRNFVCSGKNDFVRLVELTGVNPRYARVRFPDGRESIVSLQDVAPAVPPAPTSPPPGEMNEPRIVNSSGSPHQDEDPVPAGTITIESNETDNGHGSDSPHRAVPVRSSSRVNKGVPSIVYKNPVTF